VRSVRFIPIALAAVLVSGFTMTLATRSLPATKDAKGLSFTADQATKGRNAYYANCAYCHGANLEGIYGPALNGPDGNVQWQPVSAVYGYTTTQMPVGNAGGLPADDYVNIMAFLLQSHGFHAGATPLTANVARSNQTVLGQSH
jgi:polar amino acid transport system substrate-binding protein